MTGKVISPEAKRPVFPGFPEFRANVTFVPIQYFTVVLPHCSRGCVRIVGYMIRKILGWVDEQGNPTQATLRFSYRQLIEQAGVSREAIADALREAIQKHCIRCVQPPQPDRAGQPGQSAIYELLWDEHGPYSDSPLAFQGFFYPEAAEMPVREKTGVVRRSKAARKNIPNVFFDELLRQERLSVIRVVGALLFYSIQWGPGGERRVPVSFSITELSRLTKLSRQHVHEALQEAIDKGYIEKTDPGCFDPKAGESSRPATYGIRWAKTIDSDFARSGPGHAPELREGDQTSFGSLATNGDCAEPTGRHVHRSEKVNGDPVRKGEPNASEKVDGAPVKKGERERSEIVNGNRSEKVNGISIKTELKTLNTAAEVGAEQPAALSAAAVEWLVQAGFDPDSARRLAGHHSPEVIQQQIQWLPLRKATTSRLGLLRRAIEQNWPRPEASQPVPPPELEAGELFARHYYAAYHGYTGPPATEPFPKDVQLAAKFVARLLAQEPHESRVPEWGRRFGSLLRAKHHGDARAKPNLSFALVLYGDEFLRMLEQETSARHQKALGRAKEARQAALRPEYRAYLRLAEKRLQQAQPGLYAAFLKERDRTRHTMTGGLFLASADTLARFDSEEGRLESLADYFKNHPQRPVLQFWEWDAQNNTNRFEALARSSPPLANSREPRLVSD